MTNVMVPGAAMNTAFSAEADVGERRGGGRDQAAATAGAGAVAEPRHNRSREAVPWGVGCSIMEGQPSGGVFLVSNPSWQPMPWQTQGSSSSMLAAHADRERAVDVLRAGFSEGRLQQDEYEKRIERAYQARTVGELSLLVADLPQGPYGMQPGPVMGPPMVPAMVPRTFMPVPPPPVTNSKAVGSMVCGVLTTMTMGLTGIPAVILGHTARAEMRRTGEGGEGFALAGLILGWLSVAGWALFLMLMMIVGVSSGS